MKRCPRCNRVETDDTLVFCRSDGAALVSDSANISSEAGTVKLDSGAIASETETRQLSSDLTGAASTTVLATPQTTAQNRRPGTHTRMFLIVSAVLVLAIIIATSTALYLTRKTRTAIGSIAVMPFVNESGNSDVEYLSDGMTETLISSLSQLPNLNVKARSSVFRYKGKSTDANTIGKELNVQAVLNGHVMQRGDQLTLSLELVNADTENVIWSEQYKRQQADLVNLQSEIARDVASKLRLKLSGAEEEKVAKTYTSDPEAYRLYLQGRFYWNKRAGREFEKAESYFRQAIERDPRFALGYVGLADTNEDEDRPRKKEYIRRALELDDQLAEAHASLGYQYMLDYNWTQSERELNRAIELNPNYAQAHQWNGARLMMLSKYDESLASLRRALAIDPTSPGINFYYGVLLLVSGKPNDSVQQFKQLAQMEPTFTWTHMWLSRIYRQLGNYAASVEERAIAFELAGSPEKARLLRESFAKGGWKSYVNDFIRLRAGQSEAHKASNVGDASYLAELGEKQKAIDALTESANRGDFWLFTIKTDPSFNTLRGDPRFDELLKKFNPSQ